MEAELCGGKRPLFPEKRQAISPSPAAEPGDQGAESAAKAREKTLFDLPAEKSLQRTGAFGIIILSCPRRAPVPSFCRRWLIEALVLPPAFRKSGTGKGSKKKPASKRFDTQSFGIT